MTPRVRELRLVYSRGRNLTELPCVTQPSDAASLLTERLGRECVEVCCMLLLDTKHQVLATHELGRGTLDCCTVHPRDVFKVAILANAAAIVVGHNHPSGDPSPSNDDIALCTRLRHCADLIGIELLDFLIIGDGRYHSFRETQT